MNKTIDLTCNRVRLLEGHSVLRSLERHSYHGVYEATSHRRVEYSHWWGEGSERREGKGRVEG
jgi:hypothetical protein